MKGIEGKKGAERYASTQLLDEHDVPISELSGAITRHYKNPEYPKQLERIHVMNYGDGEVHALLHKPKTMLSYDTRWQDVDFVDVINDTYAGHTLVSYDPDTIPHLPSVIYTFTSEGKGRGLATRRLLAANTFCLRNLGEALNSGKGFDDDTARRIWQKFVQEGTAEEYEKDGIRRYRFKTTL